MLKIVNLDLKYKLNGMRLLFMVLMLTVTSLSFGQKKENKKTVEEKGGEMANELKKGLNLNDVQYEKAKSIYVKYLKEKEEINAKIKEFEKKKKILKVNRNDLISEVLTIEQKEELEKQKNKKKRKNKKN